MRNDREVKVHSCHAKINIESFKDLEIGDRYYSDDPKFQYFKALPKVCKCKKTVSKETAKDFLDSGKAFVIYKPKKGQALDDSCIVESHIIMPVDRTQTPRVHLISEADMERAYVDLREEYTEYIEEVHKMILEERAKLVVPFREDPTDGRLLFPFGPDQRTSVGRR